MSAPGTWRVFANWSAKARNAYNTGMSERRFTAVDRLLASAGNALRTVATPAGRPSRPNPADGIPDAPLDDTQKSHASGLMRVNHAGEIAAQALYQGHAAVARERDSESRMRAAAAEEFDHLAWCEQRLDELGARRSVLAPLWYGGAFLIGAASGILGDRWSLGFIAATEQQVCDHLDSHLDRLPANDDRSRAIVTTMREEEREHGAAAVSAGAAELPPPVRRLMKLTARVMTTTAYRI